MNDHEDCKNGCRCSDEVGVSPARICPPGGCQRNAVSVAEEEEELPEETYSDGEGPICPWCGQEWTADDALYYDEDGFEEDCSNCGKPIHIQPVITTAWITSPIEK